MPDTAAHSSDNRRIARNTMYLYLRMAFSLAIRLYTSRVVLQALGVMDYGLWNVVGCVVSMIGYLNGSMAACTNRFISYELGNGDRQSQQEVFSAALTIHLIIAAVVLLLLETVGVWFVETQMVIPAERLDACRIVYQLAVVGALAEIVQVPYNASLMAHERMDVFAYIDMANILLRLGIVWLLLVLPFDRLVMIAALSTAVGLAFLAVYRAYCERRLPACRWGLSRRWQRIRPMLSFSGWDLYGSMSVVLRMQGVSLLLNMFFTAVMNAANGVANTVQGAVMLFANNVVAAFRPQIIKSYALGEHERMNRLISKALAYTTILLLLLMLPLIIEMDYVLQLWLGEVPEWAATFSCLVLLCNLVGNAVLVVNIGIHATGHIRQLSLLNGTLYLLVLPLAWYMFSQGAAPHYPFIYNVLATLAGLVFNLFLLHRLVPGFSAWSHLGIVGKLTLIGTASCAAGCLVSGSLEVSFGRLVLVVAVTAALTLATSWVLVLGADDRRFVTAKIRRVVTR